uniref:Uncharacterized protein n=1 Tax=Oryza punctata TaxID=4537 RepID=A0A0E0KDV3_ORYPU
MKWVHYQAKIYSNGRSKADKVDEEFWAIHDHYLEVKKRQVRDKIAGQQYLTKEKYIAQKPSWCSQEAWSALADEWCDPKFRGKSEKNRANRASSKYKPHKEQGRDVTEVEAWVHTHKGENPNNPNMLNTQEATECLGRYKSKFSERNGDRSDPISSPVDSLALYESNSRKPHGKWPLFNGVVNNKEALVKVKSGSSSPALKRQRREAKDLQRRIIFKLKMARDQGYSSADIPPPLSPPPEPPISPVIDLDDSRLSDAREENGDDRVNVIAKGMFGGYLTNSSANGPINFLPALDELDPF